MWITEFQRHQGQFSFGWHRQAEALRRSWLWLHRSVLLSQLSILREVPISPLLLWPLSDSSQHLYPNITGCNF